MCSVIRVREQLGKHVFCVWENQCSNTSFLHLLAFRLLSLPVLNPVFGCAERLALRSRFR